MTAATLTSKGQITIPLSVREAMKIRQGDRVEFIEVAPGRFELLPVVKSIRNPEGTFQVEQECHHR
ncbi:MAG: AbrB/MazE/SpoVT family DNA-binding domain-containing protein [Asticcacaulis sp.]